ncbi:MAG TPA: IS1595 family transposase [Terriglobales bacterium]|jgi:transposase-like protein|nr:IS1595 family transposase [Terriglobales bacterium]
MPTTNELSPKTLQEAILHFSDEQNCIDAVAKMRWPDGVTCPACGHKKHYYLKTKRRWKCAECWRQFSAKLGTIFEKSPIPLNKWLLAMWLVTSCKNGVSSWEIHRAIGVTQKTAWFMMHRIRLSMQDGSIVKLGGEGKEVEADETFIGGKARNMHMDVRKRRITGRGISGKQVVWGVLERGGDVRCEVIVDTMKPRIHRLVKKHVAAETALYTDALGSYRGLDAEYAHKVVDHAVAYVDGRVSTNGLENFWSLLKRSISGTYVSVEPFHLFRYLGEQSFRFNNRSRREKPIHDGERFSKALAQIAGKRVTYKELTGKEHLPVVAAEPF